MIEQLRDVTLCFPLRGDPPHEVLLGFKQAGFGAGKYAGFGGKVEPGETVAQAAARELAEECGLLVVPEQLRPAGRLTFLFPARPAWSQTVHVFLARAWQGEPAESREMRPAWFPIGALPLAQMWPDNRLWLPDVLDGRAVQTRYTYAADNVTVLHAEPLSQE